MAAPYFIYVDGRAKPKRPHPDLESARKEAHRLFQLRGGLKSVLILEMCESLEPVDADTNTA